MKNKSYSVKCSCCGAEFTISSSYTSGFTDCPHCEAKFAWEVGFNNSWGIITPSQPQFLPSLDKDESVNNGGKTDYYQLSSAPFPINDFDDFAEWRKMDGFQFNIGKVAWTFNIGRHDATDEIRDLYKVIHYAKRRITKLKREKKQ